MCLLYGRLAGYEAHGIGRQIRKTQTRIEGSGIARRRRTDGPLARPLWPEAPSINSPLSPDRGGCPPNAGERTGRTQILGPPPFKAGFEQPADSRLSPHSPSLSPRAGTVLVRDWGGVTHKAKVLEDGALFRSRRYKSLSEVARVITSSRWSGPLFFRLKSTAKDQNHGTR